MQTAWIIGAGGIGKALAAHIAAMGCEVSLVSRGASQEGPFSYHCVDFLKPAEVDAWVVSQAKRPPDLIVNTIGHLHSEQYSPEKALKSMSEDALFYSMQVNVLPTAYLAQSLARHILTSKSTLTLATLSARVGSISDNRLGGWYSYRMSKASLNMLIKNISVEWRVRYPQVKIVGYHPGTVDTPLSEPFQSRVPSGHLFTRDLAAEYCYKQLIGIRSGLSGEVVDWAGQIIES